MKFTVFQGLNPILRFSKGRLRSALARRITISTALKNLSSYNFSLIVHRFVVAPNIKSPFSLTSKSVALLQSLVPLDPLHNKPSLSVIKQSLRHFKGVRQVAVFDSDFHKTILDFKRAYGIPKKFFDEGVRKFGFHGFSHKFVSSKLLGNGIVCHLGNGCSVTAVKSGVSMDTSMGFSVLDGCVMGTRSGSVDPGVIFFLAKKYNLSLSRIEKMFLSESGLLGLSGSSYDIRDLLSSKSKNAKFALDVFCYSVARNILSMCASLTSLDYLAFTGGIGQNNPVIRKLILDSLTVFDFKVSSVKNNSNSFEFSLPNSNVKLFVVECDEESVMLSSALEGL